MMDPNPDPPPLVEEIAQFEENCCLRVSLLQERLRRRWAGLPHYVTEIVFAEQSPFGSEMYSYVESQGYRAYMEDRHVATAVCDGSVGLFAVLDGHGMESEGHLIAEYATRNLPSVIDSHLQNLGGLENAAAVRERLDRAFSEVDSGVRRSLPSVAENNGTTLTAVLVDQTRIVFANLGDSRGVLVNEDYTIDFVTLDHKPSVPTEHDRVVRAGGFVDDMRVNGDLAVSRTLGDLSYKPATAPRRLCPISNEPDVTSVVRTPRHRCLVLASDGIWDGMSSQEVVDILKDFRILEPVLDNAEFKRRLEEFYRLVLAKATGERLSSDNLTVFLVVLGPRGQETTASKESSPFVTPEPISEKDLVTTGVEIELT